MIARNRIWEELKQAKLISSACKNIQIDGVPIIDGITDL